MNKSSYQLINIVNVIHISIALKIKDFIISSLHLLYCFNATTHSLYPLILPCAAQNGYTQFQYWKLFLI